MLGRWEGVGLGWRVVPCGRLRSGRRWRPSVEELEERPLQAADPGYVLSGSSWANPSRITFSFAPDGVAWDGGTNSLNAVLDARLGVGVWEKQIARALQTWASVANLNVVEVPDSSWNFDVPGVSQGDSRFGDIRIGGYGFGNATTLARTYFPPPGGYTAAGDSDINLSVPYSIGGGNSTFDLYSVMLHEMGHSLGMEHAAEPAEVMNETYQGVRGGLAAGDIAGIQAIYGARTPDSYQARGLATSLGTAADVTASLNSWGQSLVTGVSLASVGDTEVFRVKAPAGATGFQVVAGASGVSLLSPSVSIRDAAGNVLASGGDASAFGDNAWAKLPSVVAGQTYYVSVNGATRDVFATGAYQLYLGFSGVSPVSQVPPQPQPQPQPQPAPSPIIATPVPTPTPVVASPTSVPTPTPTPRVSVTPDRYQTNNRLGAAVPLGVVVNRVVTGLSVSSPTGAEYFTFRAGRRGVFRVSSPGALIQVYDARGRAFGSGSGTLLFSAPRAGGTYSVSLSSPDGSLVASTSLSIGPRVVARSRRR